MRSATALWSQFHVLQFPGQCSITLSAHPPHSQTSCYYPRVFILATDKIFAQHVLLHSFAATFRLLPALFIINSHPSCHRFPYISLTYISLTYQRRLQRPFIHCEVVKLRSTRRTCFPIFELFRAVYYLRWCPNDQRISCLSCCR